MTWLLNFLTYWSVHQTMLPDLFYYHLHLLKLHKLHNLKSLNLMSNLLWLISSIYSYENINFLSEVSNRQTRLGDSNSIHRTSICSITTTDSRLWTSLPANIILVDKWARLGDGVRAVWGHAGVFEVGGIVWRYIGTNDIVIGENEWVHFVNYFPYF